MKLFVLVLILSASATALQWTMGSGGAVTPPPPPAGNYWHGILDPSRAYDWVNAGVRGGIPDANWPVCQNLQPSGAVFWQPRRAYSVGERISDARGYVFRVVTAGTSMSEQPAWPTTAGGTVVDGTVTWTMSLGVTDLLTVPQWTRRYQYGNNAKIEDLNGNTETSTSGTSDWAKTPTWTGATVVGDPVQDNTVTWQLDSTTGSDSLNIQAAVNACGGTGQSTGQGQVVQLAAGNFYITYGIKLPNRNVVLRGAGADQTKLLVGGKDNPCGNAFICVIGNGAGSDQYTGSGQYGGTALWVDGYAQGSKMIVTSDASWIGTKPTASDAVAPGSMIFLDQRSDTVGVCPVDNTGTSVTNPNYGQPNGVGECAGQWGFVMNGSTVTVHTTRPHYFQVGQCVGLGVLNAETATNRNFLSWDGLNWKTDVTANGRIVCPPGNDLSLGWFEITSVPTPTTFTYELPNKSGLTPSGGGGAVADSGGLVVSASVMVVNSGGKPGRQCPGGGKAPVPSCDPADTKSLEQTEMAIINGVIPGGTGPCPSGDTCYTLAEGLMWGNWQTSRVPGIWWAGPNQYAQNVGFEDFTLDFTNDPNGPITYSGGCISIKGAIDSWVKGVRFVRHMRNAVWVIASSHVSVIDNYLANSSAAQSTSYGVELSGLTSRTLVANNICERGPNCVMTNDSGANVIAYNYTVDAPFYSIGTMRPKIGLNHAISSYNLYEGNDSPGVQADNVHGSATAATVFRSRLVGDDYPRKSNLWSVSLNAFMRGFNFVGNVLGIDVGVGGSRGTLDYNNDQWGLGDTGPIPQSGPNSLAGKDIFVGKTILRWGNYDVLSKANNWCGDASSPGWTTTCMGITAAYKSAAGGTPTGAAGTICWVTFEGGGTTGIGAWGYVRLGASANTIDIGTPITIISPGKGYTTAPTLARFVAISASLMGVLATACPSTQTFPVSVTTAPVSDIPGGFPYLPASFVPSSTTLPPSFYLSAQPSFWQMRSPLGTPPWPAIGPDITASGPLNATCTPTIASGPGSPTACDGTGNRSYQIPAQICYNSMQDDPAYPRPSYGPATDGRYTSVSQQLTPVTLFVANLMMSRFAASTISFPTSIDVAGVDPPTYNGRYLMQDATRELVRYERPMGNPGTFNPPTSTGSTVKPTGPKIFNEHVCYVNE